jgi:hypothetical protein
MDVRFWGARVSVPDSVKQRAEEIAGYGWDSRTLNAQRDRALAVVEFLDEVMPMIDGDEAQALVRWALGKEPT